MFYRNNIKEGNCQVILCFKYKTEHKEKAVCKAKKENSTEMLDPVCVNRMNHIIYIFYFKTWFL